MRELGRRLQEGAPQFVLPALVAALGVAIACLPWKWALLLVVGGAVLMGLLMQPQWALCLLAFAVPFGSLRQRPLGPATVGLGELLVLSLLALWLARGVVARRISIPKAPLLLPLLLFMGAASFSTLSATSLELSIKELVKWGEVLVIYVFMADAVERRWAPWVVWALLAAGGAEAAVGIWQFVRRIGPEGFLLFDRFMRAYGHFAQPNPYAGYLGLSLPLAYALSLEAFDHLRRSGFRPKDSTIPPRNEDSRATISRTSSVRGALWAVLQYTAPVAALVLIAMALVMSWSRGGWVAAAAALLVVTATRSRTALLATVAVAMLVSYVLLAGGAYLLPSSLVQRVSDFLPYLGGVNVATIEVTDANWAVVERMAHWLAALGMFSDHPWLGVGFGNYSVAYPQYALGRWQDPLGHAHNYYLNVAAETGIVGLAAYVLLWTTMLVQAWRAVRRTTVSGLGCVANRYWRAVALGGLGALVHLAVHSLFDNLFVHNMQVQVALFLGLMLVAQKTAAADDAHWH